MDVEPIGASLPPEPVEAPPPVASSTATPPPEPPRPPQEQAAPLPPGAGQIVDFFA